MSPFHLIAFQPFTTTHQLMSLGSLRVQVWRLGGVLRFSHWFMSAYSQASSVDVKGRGHQIDGVDETLFSRTALTFIFDV